MSETLHYRALENMYDKAPINNFYLPTASISEGAAEIVIETRTELFHIAGAAHGSVYFKQLDDAAYFAANSLERDYLLLTTAFTTYITRPVSSGVMRAVGKVANYNKSQFIAESVVYDSEEREIARGNGIFVRSKMKLADIPAYSDVLAG